MRRMARIKSAIDSWHSIADKCSNLFDLLELAISENDTSFESDIADEAADIERIIEEMEFKETMGGEYDANNAILAIHAGAGGTESQDWAQMLLRMYLRWCEKRHFGTDIIHTSPGDEAGIKSTLVEIQGEYAFGYLKSEHGVHRLVRLSPYDADHARHTSFALVEVMPEVESGEADVIINPDELKIDAFGSSGPGGQHMQKTSSAIRITHIPTGINVNCQSERSQARNKEMAMKVLASRLLDLEMSKRAEEHARLKGEHVSAGWGNQIRSYVLHPYKMVKDHRSGYENSNPEAVLEGELDDVITAYLKSMLE